MKPHLLNQFKYDLRIYVLVTSFDPLTIYIYQDGLVRFATQPYSTKNRKQRFAHLTNFSVNKKALNFKKPEENNEGESASKWSLKALRIAMEKQGINFADVWSKIKDIITKSLIAVEPVLTSNLNRASRNRHLCFEMYGFDIILDHKLKPWLLEINVLPSLSASSKMDKRIKTSLMTDIFGLVGIVPYSKKRLDKLEENSKWKRFSGIPKAQQKFAGEECDSPQDSPCKHGNVIADDESSGGQNVHEYVAQSQSNYLPSMIRPVKELQHTTDLNTEEQLVIVEYIEEYLRRGNFELVFPTTENCNKYKKYFRNQRSCNFLLWKWLRAGPGERIAMIKEFGIRKRCNEQTLNEIK
jgi:hypothetical protein